MKGVLLTLAAIMLVFGLIAIGLGYDAQQPEKDSQPIAVDKKAFYACANELGWEVQNWKFPEYCGRVGTAVNNFLDQGETVFAFYDIDTNKLLASGTVIR